MDFLPDMFKDLLKYVNVLVIFLGLCITELGKKWIPDNVEGEWIPVVGIVFCVLFSVFFVENPDYKNRIIIGLVNGCLITGGYSVLMNFVKNIGANKGNDQSKLVDEIKKDVSK